MKMLDPTTMLFVIPTGDLEAFQPVSEFLRRSKDTDSLEFARLPFTTPLYILYSSGTSGPPKCLVHSHAAILQHKKIGMLHNSLKPGEVVFQYSSTSWVLWNIMVGHLAMGTTLIMYDGSPTWPQPQHLLRIVQNHKVNYWGVSPKYLKELESTGCRPGSEYDLSSLRMVQTGGSHLSADQYHWFYRVFPSRVHLTSVTGGTDLVTSWCGTDPAGPVYPGEIQMPILGHDVDIADPVDGHSIKGTGEAGEFICRKPFPSMPVYFWGDKNGEKYHSSYFSRYNFPCWAQHDWASVNPSTKGWTVHGRRYVVASLVFVSTYAQMLTQPLRSPLVTAYSTRKVYVLVRQKSIPSRKLCRSPTRSPPRSVWVERDEAAIVMSLSFCLSSCATDISSPRPLKLRSRTRSVKD